MLIHHGTHVGSATGDRALFNSLSEVFNCSQQMAQHCCNWIGYCTTYGHKVLNVVFIQSHTITPEEMTEQATAESESKAE